MGYCGVDVKSRTTIGDISLIYSLQYIYIHIVGYYGIKNRITKRFMETLWDGISEIYTHPYHTQPIWGYGSVQKRFLLQISLVVCNLDGRNNDKP
jgi:hypothetical protein